MSKREPISRVIDEPSTPPALRAQLEAVAAIRDFASRELGLPDNGSYRSYADVGRPLRGVERGRRAGVLGRRQAMVLSHRRLRRLSRLFRRKQGHAALPQALRGRGFDVTVGGVAAYSTLGHFNDPVLNTMMGWNDVELAAIIFHELTHQLLYVPNDSSFNEALATTVEEEGVRRWLRAQGREADLASHLVQQEHYAKVIDLLSATRAELRAVYASGLAPRPDARAKARRVRRHARLLRAAQGAAGAATLRSNPGSTATSTMPTWRRSPPTSPACRASSANLRPWAATSPPFTPGSARSQNSIRPNAMLSSAARLMLGQTA